MVNCWLCDSNATQITSSGVMPEHLTPQHFAITDAHYGTTLNLYRCDACHFIFCGNAENILSYYQKLTDEEYEHGREQRRMQASRLLKKIYKHKSSGTLLDIGAASGILVQEAIVMGYDASGIDPCAWLVEKAKAQSIPVIDGVFPDPRLSPSYDVITLIDVLEHVENPVALLSEISKKLHHEGIAVMVTPDVRSVAARIMGRKWWHFRTAHIGYFDKANLTSALRKAGLEPIAWMRPAWYFSLDYLIVRLGVYVPVIRKLRYFRAIQSITVPLNLYDSWMVFAIKRQ